MTFRTLTLAAASVWALGAQVHPAITEIKTVYLLNMASGLDQYLANQLTRMGRFEVVTDPKLADAIFTDRLGPSFEDRLTELYPPPPPPAPPDDATETATETKSATNLLRDEATTPPVVRISSFGRGRGNVFLVSRKDRTVLWSHYEPPRGTQSRDLNGTAGSIVDRLEGDLKKQ
jgi:hypothetical protein